MSGVIKLSLKAGLGLLLSLNSGRCLAIAIPKAPQSEASMSIAPVEAVRARTDIAIRRIKSLLLSDHKDSPSQLERLKKLQKDYQSRS